MSPAGNPHPSGRGGGQELAPTQRAALTNHAGAARWAWNWGLAVRREAWQRRRQTLNAMDLHRLLNRLKRTAR